MTQGLFYSFSGSVFTWGVTALGASLVFVLKRIGQSSLNFLFAVASGIMISSSCFGLIHPALEAAESSYGKNSWIPVSLGIFVAYAVFAVFDQILTRSLDKNDDQEEMIVSLVKKVENIKMKNDDKINSDSNFNKKSSLKNGVNGCINPIVSNKEVQNGTSLKNGEIYLGQNQIRNRKKQISKTENKDEAISAKEKQKKINKIILLVSAITLHNLPEGLAVGIACGAYNICIEKKDYACADKSFGNAISLIIGIAIQNFPEGIAIAFPLRKCGMNPLKSFWYGQLSAVVEPVGAILGVLLTSRMENLLPYFLGFAAGAMLYVTVCEMIPELYKDDKNKIFSNFGFVLGFILMMILEGIIE